MNRSAEIARWYVWSRVGADIADVLEYARVAAAWEAFRRALDDATPADRDRYHRLTGTMRTLVTDLGLTACTEENEYSTPGVTDVNGFLVGDPARLLYANWRASLI